MCITHTRTHTCRERERDRKKERETLFLGKLQIWVLTGYPRSTDDVGGGFLEGFFGCLFFFLRVRQGESGTDGLLVKIAVLKYKIQVYLDKANTFWGSQLLMYCH